MTLTAGAAEANSEYANNGGGYFYYYFRYRATTGRRHYKCPMGWPANPTG